MRDGRIMTSGGVTAGIDMAFSLAEEIAGLPLANAVRLSMEYRLEEKLGDADPERAPADVRQRAIDELNSSAREERD